MPLPASNSLNSLIINSDGIRAERSILFVACTWMLQHWLQKKKKKRKKTKMEKPPSSKECCEDGNMMYCNHMLPVGFIKFSLFTHSQAYFKCTHKKKVCISTHQDRGGMEPEHNRHNPTFHTNTRFPLSFLFPHLLDEIEVAMPWLYAADARTSVSPRGEAI